MEKSRGAVAVRGYHISAKFLEQQLACFIEGYGIGLSASGCPDLLPPKMGCCP